MTKAERDLSLTWQHDDRRCSVSDLEYDLLMPVITEADLMDDELIAFNNRLYAGGCPNGD